MTPGPFLEIVTYKCNKTQNKGTPCDFENYPLPLILTLGHVRMLLNTKTSAYVLIGESTFNEVGKRLHCTSVYLFFEIFYFSIYFHDKIQPKKEQLFLFFNPRDLIMNCMKAWAYPNGNIALYLHFCPTDGLDIFSYYFFIP